MNRLISDINELESMALSDEDTEVKRIFKLISSFSTKAERIARQYNSDGSREGMCEILTADFNSVLVANGLSPKSLQGDISISETDFVEHVVTLIRLERLWITVDFAANQFERFRGAPFVVTICDPDKVSLADALTREYSWWSGGSANDASAK